MSFPHTESRLLPPVKLRNDALIGTNAVLPTRIKPLTLGPDLFGRPPVEIPGRYITDEAYLKTTGRIEECKAYKLGGEWTIDPQLNLPSFLKTTIQYVTRSSSKYGLIIGKNDFAFYDLKNLHCGPLFAFKDGNKNQPSFSLLFDEIIFPNGMRSGVWATIICNPLLFADKGSIGRFGSAVVESIWKQPTAQGDIRNYVEIRYHIDMPV